MTHTTLIVRGMSCESCRTAVSDALDLPGVDRVDVDLESGRVDVVHAEKVTVDMLVNAVDDTGYEVPDGGSR